MSCRLVWLLLMMMPAITCALENDTTWELLEATANPAPIDKGRMLTIEGIYRYDLWNRYISSSTSQRLEVVNEISETLKEVASWNSKLDMVGVILFDSVKGHLLLNLGHGKSPQLVDPVDHIQCCEVLYYLLPKHCGPRAFNGMRHLYSESNMCFLATNETIEEALILSCARSAIEPVESKQVPFDMFLAVLQNYACSPWAMAAVVFCLALDYVIRSIGDFVFPEESCDARRRRKWLNDCQLSSDV